MDWNTEYELYHHGVKGMKWGVRKKRLPVSDTRARYDAAKQKKKQAQKEYNKAAGKAMANPLNAFTKKGAKRYDIAADKAAKSIEADAAYKVAEAKRQTKIDKVARKLRREATVADKLTYNNATRRKAAQYVVDNNMSVAEATKKAKGDAWRNTAIFVGAYAAIAARSLYLQNR